MGCFNHHNRILKWGVVIPLIIPNGSPIFPNGILRVPQEPPPNPLNTLRAARLADFWAETVKEWTKAPPGMVRKKPVANKWDELYTNICKW